MIRFLYRAWLRAPQPASLESLVFACATHERHENVESTSDWIAKPGQHATLTLLRSSVNADPKTVDVAFQHLDGTNLGGENTSGLPSNVALDQIAVIHMKRPANAIEADKDVTDLATALDVG